jgi:hypothetical protein
MSDRWHTGYRARQDRAAAERFARDPQAQAAYAEHLARLNYRALIIRRYGVLLAAALSRGDVTVERAFALAFQAQDRKLRSHRAPR